MLTSRLSSNAEASSSGAHWRKTDLGNLTLGFLINSAAVQDCLPQFYAPGPNRMTQISNQKLCAAAIQGRSEVQRESMQLLDWPALCRQVAAFAATPMAAEMLLQEGLPLGSTQVSHPHITSGPQQSFSGFCNGRQFSFCFSAFSLWVSGAFLPILYNHGIKVSALRDGKGPACDGLQEDSERLLEETAQAQAAELDLSSIQDIRLMLEAVQQGRSLHPLHLTAIASTLEAALHVEQQLVMTSDARSGGSRR